MAAGWNPGAIGKSQALPAARYLSGGESGFEVIRYAVENGDVAIHSPAFSTLADYRAATFEIRWLFRPVDALTVQEVVFLRS